jgi:hypothetical protein
MRFPTFRRAADALGRVLLWLQTQFVAKPWLRTMVCVIFGGCICSVLLEGITQIMVWHFVPRIHDVQHIALMVGISFIGLLLGGTVGLAVSPARTRHPVWVGLFPFGFGSLAANVCLYEIRRAHEIFSISKRPLVDALAYFGPLLVCSTLLSCYGVCLLFARGRGAGRERG